MFPAPAGRKACATYVAQTFLSAGSGDFPVALPSPTFNHTPSRPAPNCPFTPARLCGTNRATYQTARSYEKIVSFGRGVFRNPGVGQNANDIGGPTERRPGS